MTDAKLEARIFTGPEICSVIIDSSLPASLNEMELEVWSSFFNVVKKFLENHKAENHHQLIQNMLKSCERMGCRMSLKMHFLHSHLDFFPANLGAVSDEHGKCFHQQTLIMENRYNCNFNPNLMEDYCWFLQTETSSSFKQQKKRKHQSFT